jgi:hypothetical protein
MTAPLDLRAVEARANKLRLLANGPGSRWAAAAEDITALLAALRATRAALIPLGAKLGAYVKACADGENLELFTARFDFAVHRVCVGDLRHAAAVLASVSDGEER